MPGKNRSRKTFHRVVKADINITPLIDVLLVLIVIFMLITPVDSTGLDTSIPQPPSGAEKAREGDILLSLDESGALRINNENTTLSALEERLKSIFKTRADRTVFVKADSRLDFDGVAHVI